MKNTQKNTDYNFSLKRVWAIMIAVGLLIFMSTLDSSVVNVAMPVMSKDLNVPMNQITWTVSIYLIVVSGLLTFFGNLGDQIGKMRVFKYGAYVFVLGSFLAGINLNFWFLLFARVVQAIGAAMEMSNSFGISTTVAPVSMRARAMASIAMFVSLGGLAGPSVGGIILQFFPWSYIFWINVPIGIIVIIIIQKVFPKSAKREDKVQFDWYGIILLFLLIALFFMGINIAQEQGFTALFPIFSYLLSIILLFAFIKHELKITKPLLDLSIFKTQLFTISIIASFLTFSATFFIAILTPFYFQNLLGMSPGKAGLFMMAWPIAQLIGAPFSGIIADKINREYITLAALSAMLIGLFMWTLIGKQTPVILVFALNAFLGFSMSFFNTPNNALIMSNAPKNKLGVAGSLNALARNLGMITGTTAATTSLYIGMSIKAGHKIINYPKNNPYFFVSGLHFAMMISTIIILIAWLITAYRVLILKIKK
ncbi:MAG: MFS transporter [Lactobacillaceae bacterium]|jgi:EmrB/QacA subfamily drug resistance transporter|nr:MFS transporter [Lactobacillaceae bacterium]